MKIILYKSDVCPKCKILTQKLIQAKFNFEIVDDIEKMISMGINKVPILNVDGHKMEFVEANKWINERMNNK